MHNVRYMLNLHICNKTLDGDVSSSNIQIIVSLVSENLHEERVFCPHTKEQKKIKKKEKIKRSMVPHP